ncbi:LCP family protein [Streptomyces glaucosporus]|uniref:LCP family protein n=1 Tax=Streptomyces glaucosporus TaxID=284044 RepID=A0ABP5VXQ5_9ACTN
MGHSTVRGEGARGRRSPGAGDLGRNDGHRDRTGESDGEGSGSGGDGGRGAVPGPRDGRRPGASRRARRPRRRVRVLRWAALGLSVLVLGTAGAGYLYYEHLNGRIDKDPLNLGDREMGSSAPNAAGQRPLNILLIGSDSRNSEENLRLGGARDSRGSEPLADVQMLLHLSADRSNISAISMPRDTMLRIPRCTDPDDGTVYPADTTPTMTNESLGRGGPGCTVATWYELTGIPIDHFMMIDFAGVVSMADAVGGVPVCVDANIHSRTHDGKGSGLKLTKGTHHVQGEQALQWLRTRYGFEDNSDLGRTRAQHMYMNSMVRQLRKNARLSNPDKLRRLAEAATDALVVDQGLGSIGKLLDLGNELKKVPPSRITMTTMPWVWSQTHRGRVEPKPGDAEKLFAMVRDDVPLDGKGGGKGRKDGKGGGGTGKAKPADPAAEKSEIGVVVRNGTGHDARGPVSGRASAVAATLVSKGFTRAASDPAPSPREKTVIRYPDAGLEGDARAVADALGLPADALRKSDEVTGITLIVGADWRTGTLYPRAGKDDGGVPASARALSGGDTGACMHVNPAFTW